MALVLLLAFIGVPLAEIALFIEIGGRLGLLATLAVVIATGVAGTWLLRAQGLVTLRRAQASLNRGEMPVAEIFDGACLLVAGVLLLTPGFLTDVLGLVLFVPAVRGGLRSLLWHYGVRSGRIQIWVDGRPPSAPGGPILDGEYEDLDETDRGDATRPGPPGAPKAPP
jgi:UPF0716 protein FxsA